MSQHNRNCRTGDRSACEDGVRCLAVPRADRRMLLGYGYVLGDHGLADIDHNLPPQRSTVGEEGIPSCRHRSQSRPTAAPRTYPRRGPSRPWTIVGLGDSFTATQKFEGQTYLELFAASLEQTTGRTVTVADLSDDADTTARVADRLRTGEVTRGRCRSGHHPGVRWWQRQRSFRGVSGRHVFAQPTRGGLSRRVSPTFVANYEAILSEIESLREGRPTAIRVTSADNPFVGWSLAPSATFGIDFTRKSPPCRPRLHAPLRPPTAGSASTICTSSADPTAPPTLPRTLAQITPIQETSAFKRSPTS